MKSTSWQSRNIIVSGRTLSISSSLRRTLGIGSGVIANGRIYRGARGAAGEIGHIQVEVRGRTLVPLRDVGLSRGPRLRMGACGSDWSADSASGGNRISIQYCVVIFLLFDLLTMAGIGFLVTEVGTSYGLYPSTAFDDQALTVGVALFLFILLAFSVDAYKSRCILDLRYSVARIIIALFITFLVLLTLGAATKTSQIYSQVWFLSWAALACAILPAFRVAARAHIREELDNKGAFVFRALSVGIFGDPLSREEISRRTDNQVKTVNAMRLEGFRPARGTF